MKKFLKTTSKLIDLINEILELFTNFSMMSFRSAQAYHGSFN